MEFKLDRVEGKFAQRGDESVKQLNTLEYVAQDKKVLDLMKVGEAGNTVVGVATVEDHNYNNNINMIMVTWDYYEFMAFTSESKLKAVNNFSWSAVIVTGAYSNYYKVGAGYTDYSKAQEQGVN